MIGVTFCSGIGAPEMAAPWIDWCFASEIDDFPRAVLRHRLGYRDPKDHNQGDPLLWGDLTTVTPDLWRDHGLPLPDLIVAGTPCQSFSVAGLRKGLEDDRGNLTLKFVEIVHAIVDARPDGTLTVLWENVPGVLSDKGNAFGAFLGGIVGTDDAFTTPDGGSWPCVGMVEGPRARAAWRVLDAQYFGVAQRRRRLFVVVSFGNGADPAAVLFEPQGVQRNTPPRREAGEGAAASLTASTGGCSGKDKPEGRLIASHDPACTLTARERKGALPEADLSTVIAEPVAFDSTQITSKANYSNPKPGDPCHPLAAGAHPPAIAFDCKGTKVQTDETGTALPLRAMGHAKSHQNAGGQLAVAFQDRFRGDDGRGYDRPPPVFHDHTGALETVKPWHVAEPWAVRRLTPTECHRLQGFSDDHCNIPWGKNDHAPDGRQYKALGNSMAVPVLTWLMERITLAVGEVRT